MNKTEILEIMVSDINKLKGVLENSDEPINAVTFVPFHFSGYKLRIMCDPEYLREKTPKESLSFLLGQLVSSRLDLLESLISKDSITVLGGMVDFSSWLVGRGYTLQIIPRGFFPRVKWFLLNMGVFIGL